MLAFFLEYCCFVYQYVFLLSKSNTSFVTHYFYVAMSRFKLFKP
jgi:hypothetical protein